jgi:2-polyprenyl-3-methyl-5-hydroxy-6-metoxy-1,4-benzoquinol methylase
MENPTTPLSASKKDYAYDHIADNWGEWINNYDTQRRIDVLVDNFLGHASIEGKHCLDAGCGLGFFTEALLKHKPARLMAIDIAPKLVDRAKQKFPNIETEGVDLTNMKSSMAGRESSFDLILSSDVIEHTQCPKTAIQQMTLYLKKDGLLAISVPNRRWKWLLLLAQFLRVRKNYQGHENWVGPHDLIKWLKDENFEIIRTEGIHTVPWQFLPKPVLRQIDRWLKNHNYYFALNLAVLAKKMT